MLNNKTIQSLISASPLFHLSNTGWSVGKCPQCSDYKERAGFKFDGNSIIYNCWNCSTTAGYEEQSGKMTKTFKSILEAMQLDMDEVSKILGSARLIIQPQTISTINLASLLEVDTSTPEINLPKKTYPLGHPEFIQFQEKIINYLLSRNIDPIKFNFFFSFEEKLIDRVIIPFYRNEVLIYWQARLLPDALGKRYENPPIKREAVIFNIDKLYTFNEEPLFVTEGVFDAMLIDGIAILGSSLNDAKKELLRNSRRRLIFIIDKDKNGKSLAYEVLQEGWEITFTPNGASDLSDSITKYGKLWSFHEIMKAIPKDRNSANFAIKINCR